MTDILDGIWTFLGNLDWMRVFFTIVFTLTAVVLGIWFPAKMLAEHTNQPLAKPVWYFISTIALVMIYICMYGYGHFWVLYSENPESQHAAPMNP